MDSITVPGKLFVMGEYSVIAGGKAVLAALKPGYGFSKNSGTEIAIHPESPAGKFSPDLKLYETSPGLDAGFGSSTAQLIASRSFQNGKTADTSESLRWYQSNFPDVSGGDLAVQNEAILTGEALFEFSGRNQVRPLQHLTPLTRILVFRSPRDHKIATHENLKQKRAEVSIETANAFVTRLEKCLQTETSDDWKVLTEWANWLSGLGLESGFAKHARTQLIRTSGVIGAKGCGAGLNDVFIVAIADERHESNIATGFDVKTRVLAVAEALQLTFIGTLEELLWQA